MCMCVRCVCVGSHAMEQVGLSEDSHVELSFPSFLRVLEPRLGPWCFTCSASPVLGFDFCVLCTREANVQRQGRCGMRCPLLDAVPSHSPVASSATLVSDSTHITRNSSDPVVTWLFTRVLGT